MDGWTTRVAAATLVAMAGADLAVAEEATGTWRTQEGDGGRYLHVAIMPCQGGGTLCGTISGAFEGADTGLVGKPIIWDMTPDGAAAWSGGRIWAPDEDETYRAKMALRGAVLEVSGCILGGLVCRGQDWTRVD
ncbi:MAG: DUF2147 domain-containing protein [Pseudomonadota bacterium]